MNKTLLILALALIFLASPSIQANSAYGAPITTEEYEISRSILVREISHGSIFKDTIEFKNPQDRQLQFSIFSSDSLDKVLEINEVAAIVKPLNSTSVSLTVTGKEIGFFTGEIGFSGDIIEKIPVNITVLNDSLGHKFSINLETSKKKFSPNEPLEYEVQVEKILNTQDLRNITFTYSLIKKSDNSTVLLGSEVKDILGSFQIRKKSALPEDVEETLYVLKATANHSSVEYETLSELEIKSPFWQIKLFGFLPVWLLASFLGALAFLIGGLIWIKKIIKSRKKYAMQLDAKTLPKKNDRTLWLGKVAETKNKTAYLDMDALTTHGVVAGATGGGKSISAQVIIEEVLNKNTAVIVFDPTAQWSGMLRKCTDKKMLSFYPKFGLKASDAKAFPGNVRQIQNERQAIDIRKYMNPGQIQIFTMNKLTPPQIDKFVATVIASIFKSDPKEHPELRVLLVFDEVHRLLPKFGGSGKGFLQIERACREFRKWGFGVLLVSQVLSDFVGEIKANINTEVQMRTRDEADLNRLKTKYGEEFLQSLIKASVGVGMFVNPKYNRGKPYFVNFRPILHNTRRLSDEILEKYNKYGEQIDEIEYQIQQLEELKQDTFDIKMELKLVKDKLMTGNFTVVDIYLEGLKPRLEKLWTSIGKKPKKREILLVDEEEIESSLAAAEKGRAEFEKGQKKEEDEKDSKEKKVSVEDKIVAPITFDNGIMVSSLKELKDVLPGLDQEVFAIHVNQEKNEIADWVEKNVDPNIGSKLKSAKTKEDLVNALNQQSKDKNEKSKNDKDKKEVSSPKDSDAQSKDEQSEDKSESASDSKSKKEDVNDEKENNEENSKEDSEEKGQQEDSKEKDKEVGSSTRQGSTQQSEDSHSKNESDSSEKEESVKEKANK